MSLLSSKWFILPSVGLLILATLYVFGKKSVHSEMIIPAAKQQVWSVLTDTNNYAEWNKVLLVLDGSFEPGKFVKYAFYQDSENSYEITAKVKQMIEHEVLNQTGGTSGILTFDHRYKLEEVKEGTKVIIHEEYRGIAVPFWNPAPVEKAYERLNLQLKQRVLDVI